MSNTKHYFEKTVGKTHTVYGPYATIQEAREASFFHKEINALYHEQTQRHSGRVTFSTCGYEDNELATSAAHAGELGRIPRRTSYGSH